VRVEAVPYLTVLGLALKVMTGGAAVTETVAVCAAVPWAPKQVNV
jgi:hypothetical protein